MEVIYHSCSIKVFFCVRSPGEGLHPLRAAGLPVLGRGPGQYDGGVPGAGPEERRDAEDVPRSERGPRPHRRHQHHHHFCPSASTCRRQMDCQGPEVTHIYNLGLS